MKSDIPNSLLFKSNGGVSLCTTHFVTIVCYPFCMLAATQWEESAEGSSVHCLQTGGNPLCLFLEWSAHGWARSRPREGQGGVELSI